MNLSSRMPLYTRRGGPAHLVKTKGGLETLCGARGVHIEHTHPVRITCRRCIKLDEINAGKRKGRRPKKFGQKFRQQLLLGGERRNGGWTPPGVSVETSQNGRLNLRKTDDKRLPWVVVDLQDEQKVYMSDSKSKALAAMHKLAAESYRTASDDVREAEHRERAVRMIEGAREHARRIESGEITRGPVIAGVQMWKQRENPIGGLRRRNGSPRNIEHGLERARYIQQDAHEALLSAATKRDMRAVKKYADQIARAQEAEQELERAMSYVGKAQRKRHITGSWRTEDRLKDVGLAEWRQKLAGQSVGRALGKLRPNSGGAHVAAMDALQAGDQVSITVERAYAGRKTMTGRVITHDGPYILFSGARGGKSIFRRVARSVDGHPRWYLDASGSPQVSAVSVR